jgi:hypothetical protein
MAEGELVDVPRGTQISKVSVVVIGSTVRGLAIASLTFANLGKSSVSIDFVLFATSRQLCRAT